VRLGPHRLLDRSGPNDPFGVSMFRRLVRDESGIAITEYGLLIALIAVLLIGVVSVFSSSISSWFASKSSKITSF
jgi:Flp pilus assembly pilin Flp